MKIIWSPKKTGQQKGIKKKARGTRRKNESVSTIRINQKEDPRTEKENGKINERSDKLKKVDEIRTYSSFSFFTFSSSSENRYKQEKSKKKKKKKPRNPRQKQRAKRNCIEWTR